MGFIVAGCLGLYGYTFVDFGPSFKVYDSNGEEPKSGVICEITKGNPGIVTIMDDDRPIFVDDEWVKFKEVEGMVEINE